MICAGFALCTTVNEVTFFLSIIGAVRVDFTDDLCWIRPVHYGERGDILSEHHRSSQSRLH